MTHLRSALAGVAAIAALGAGGASAAAAGAAHPSATLTQLMAEVGGRGAAATPERFASLAKLDGRLQAVAASRLGTGSAAGARATAQQQGVTVSPEGDVLVEVYVRGDAAHAESALRALGMRITAAGKRAPQRTVDGYLPPGALPAAAALPLTQAVLTPLLGLSAGSVLSQGDAAIDGPEARAALGAGAAGAGVAVGVISDSIGNIGASVGTGDLPANTVDLSGAAGTDEGRAMAEIVYDEAPGLSGIYFETANGGPAAKASAIDDLVAHGVKVIADDTTYLGEPFFQDDLVAQAVDRARAAGVAYFAAAGNDSRNAWEGTFKPAGTGGATTNDFGSGDTVQSIGPIPPGDTVTFVLQWAEPWGRAATDLAVDAFREPGDIPVATPPDTANIATGVPEEAFSFTAPTGGQATTLGVAIRRVAGGGTPFMKYIAYTNGPILTMEHPSGAGSIGPDAASASGALTVAASRYTTPQAPEAFSSRGPVTHYFDADGSALAAPEVRQKPELAAPDGVDTSVTGFNSAEPFLGTSAATPAAAGIAALIRSAKPAMAIDELYAIMTDSLNALDCTASAVVPDPDCGAGFVLADRAVAMALDATPPVVTPAVTPAAPDGANGWYRGPVTVSWSAADAESPVVDPAGCAAASPGEGVSLLTCSATSAGGTTSLPLTIRRDSSAPSAPAITGLRARSYLPAALPKASAVRCTAADPTSGIQGCTVTGYTTRFGAHTLVATATNEAGLTTTSRLRFSVARPVAIAKLKLTNPRLARLRSSGLTLTVRIAAARTRLVVRLAAAVPTARGTRTLTIGSLTTKRIGAGPRTLHIFLTPAAKRALAALAAARLKITVAASSPGAKAATLKGSLTVRR